jgi:hypothetical protein
MREYHQPRNNGSPSKRKFRGFNFYIQSNEKLKQSNRERLIKESEVHLNEVTSSLHLQIEEQIRSGVIDELDSSLTDYELLEQWNHMYDEYGYLMSEFSKQWEKEKIGNKPPEESPSIVQTLINEIESLKSRISDLERSNHDSILSLRF